MVVTGVFTDVVDNMLDDPPISHIQDLISPFFVVDLSLNSAFTGTHPRVVFTSKSATGFSYTFMTFSLHVLAESPVVVLTVRHMVNSPDFVKIDPGFCLTEMTPPISQYQSLIVPDDVVD